MQRQTSRKGILGSPVIQKNTTDILDVPGLVATSDISQMLGTAQSQEQVAVANTQEFCTFFLQDQCFGVPVEQVQEVIRYQEMTRVPLGPQVVQGLINLRGQIVMAIDLRRRLGMEERPPSQLPMNVVVRTEDGAVSFLVDEIGDVIRVERDKLEAPPETLRGPTRAMVLGVYKLPRQLLLELNIATAVAIDNPKGHPAVQA